jgi:hypothetical protein
MKKVENEPSLILLFFLLVFLIFNIANAQDLQKNFSLTGVVVDSVSDNGLADVDLSFRK